VPELVQRVKKKYPNGDFRVGDARDLSQFEDESFDFVLFSYNGIDVISHPDRLRTSREIYRVLKRTAH
jgi:ubiquinone/menaquinone biosynthesis C-methylase UbiE